MRPLITNITAILVSFLVISSFALTAFPAGGLDFLAPSAYDGGRGFAVGDMNLDGNQDVVSVRADRVEVRFGDGSGKLNPTVSTAYQCSGFSSTAMTTPFVGDYTGDGKADIAVWVDDSGCRGGRAVLVLPGNGGGGFGEPIFTEISNFVFTPNQFLSADVNGDGRPDLLTAIAFSGTFDRIGVLINNGNGTFAAPVEYNMTGSQSGSNLTLGDMNSDGRPDLFYGSLSPSNVMVLVNNGNGTFAAPTTAITGTSGVAAVGNFNSDGFLDIVTTSVSGTVPSIRVWTGNGSGTFAAAAPLTLSLTRSGIGRVVPGDYNNDGKLDAAIQASNRTVVVRGNGDGTLTEDEVYAVGGGGSLFKSDLNNDGWTDLGVTQALGSQGSPFGASGEYAVLANLQNGKFAAAPAIEIPFGGEELALADMNGDGLKDLALTGDAQMGEIALILQDPTPLKANAFGGQWQRPQRRTRLAGASSISPRTIAVGDLNGDGKIDAVAAGAKANGGTDNVLAAKNDGAGNLSLFSAFGLPGVVTKVIIGKFNADNIPDLAFSETIDTTSPIPAVYVAFGNGNGTFSAPVGYLTNNLAANSLTAADFNGDQSTDIAAALTNGTVAILINNGSGTFSPGATYTPGGNLTDITSADLNGDTKADLIVAGNTSFTNEPAKVSVYPGNGNGTFSAPAAYPTVYIYSQKLTTGDFSGDGKTDVAVSNNGVVTVLVNNGTGVLSARTLWASTGALRAIASGDMDNDGKTDILTTSSYDQFFSIGFLYNASTPEMTNHAPFDFDGDGKTDAAVYRPSTGDWYLLRSTAGFGAFHFGSPSDILTPADFTGDGKTDIAVFRPSVGTWFVLRSEDSTFYGAGFGTTGDTPTPGDFDGDGKADLAVFRPGAQAYWYLQQSTAGFAVVPFGTTGDVPAAGDYDGDGKNDVSVYRPSLGQWFRFNSGNGTFYGVQFGAVGDMIVPADYTGDGKTDNAVFRPSTSTWYVLRSETPTFYGAAFGTAGDLPSPGDYDGDGKADLAVWRSGAQSIFYIQGSTSGFTVIPWGVAGDRPTANAYVY